MKELYRVEIGKYLHKKRKEMYLHEIKRCREVGMKLKVLGRADELNNLITGKPDKYIAWELLSGVSDR